MSLITYNGLCELVENGVITDVPPEHINAASIDVTLGPVVWLEAAGDGGVVDLARKEVPHMIPSEIGAGGFLLRPGEFCLAQTAERFNLPNDIGAEFRLKSGCARSGLDQALAVWCDPGWHGSVLTLELRNNLRSHALQLRRGMKIGQMVFWRGGLVPPHASYATRGQYNQDVVAQPSKGVR